MTRLALAMILAAGLAAPAMGQVYGQANQTRHTIEQPAPTIEVVFVLDTTGSMGGLIEGAKQKIWAIANAMVTGEPKPSVRMGLVAYRDRGDAYVTELTQLTDDLDAVYERLMKFEANGGGDGPESVNQALHEAVHSTSWSWDDDVLRIVYLVGDAPPHMDYEQDILYPETCELAATRGIIINTIQCGGNGATTPIWQEIARSAEGEFFQIAQSGGMQAISTPYDEELGRLGAVFGSTRYRYGDIMALAAGEDRRERASRLDAMAPAEAKADRAAYQVMASLESGDLIDDVTSGKVKLADLDDEELPEVMRPMTLEEREAYVAEQAKIRTEARERIEELNEKRRQFIEEELKRLGAEDAFDAKVLESLERQAKRIGVAYEGE